MNIVPDLNKADLKISDIAFVDENNKRKGGLDYNKLKKLMNYRALTLLRSDLSKVIYDHLDKEIEIIFGDSISKIDQNENETVVQLSERSYSLLSFGNWRRRPSFKCAEAGFWKRSTI